MAYLRQIVKIVGSCPSISLAVVKRGETINLYA